jgi:hypothetical protein
MHDRNIHTLTSHLGQPPLYTLLPLLLTSFRSPLSSSFPSYTIHFATLWTPPISLWPCSILSAKKINLLALLLTGMSPLFRKSVGISVHV